ncbi:hypothetical protein [Virgibacillus halodenitrificans]|uniref:hypothetical protein n=1 Tax=Virgibacillus halodenitrificans TaxID=1482 RepID=UPI002DBC8BAC|nr:hypothetical protein [Virgibacillus halodenitrificans]MEC2158008.1 hypothetical protein [Virgibacillus halodenitrificans]
MRMRSDMSCYLTHLTKPSIIEGQKKSSVEILIDIPREKKIKGSNPSSGFINGADSAVLPRCSFIWSQSKCTPQATRSP